MKLCWRLVASFPRTALGEAPGAASSGALIGPFLKHAASSQRATTNPRLTDYIFQNRLVLHSISTRLPAMLVQCRPLPHLCVKHCAGRVLEPQNHSIAPPTMLLLLDLDLLFSRGVCFLVDRCLHNLPLPLLLSSALLCSVPLPIPACKRAPRPSLNPLFSSSLLFQRLSRRWLSLTQYCCWQHTQPSPSPVRYPSMADSCKYNPHNSVRRTHN